MTRVFTFLVLVLVMSANADTNVFPLLTIGDRTYTNARISSVTATDAIVIFDGGGTKVPLTNLPPDLQRKFPYDAEKAGKFFAEKKGKAETTQKQLAAQQAALQEVSKWRGEPKRMRVLKRIGSLGMENYSVETEDEGERTVIINLPSEIEKHLSDISILEATITTASERHKINSKAAEKASALAPTSAGGSPQYVAAAMAQRDRANLMVLQAKEEGERLETMKEKLSELHNQSKKKTAFMASKTAKQYAGFEIWEYVGKISEKKTIAVGD
jgi:hypothetical protein